jgi:chitinase
MRVFLFIAVVFSSTTVLAQSSSSSSSASSVSSSNSSSSSSRSSSSSVSSASSSSVSATPTPTPSPCQIVAECVYDNVPPSVASCFSSTPSCTSNNQRQFSTTAEQLADSAIENKKCSGRTWRRRELCNLCYNQSKAPLRDRFYGKLFKGLLAQATKIIDTRQKAICGAVAK